ncbi:MAG TPA: DNA gyrase subunit A [Stellaceae bacterium]|nr:DNA gyrase subunit A [Stellaceae bacterium]
MADQPAAPSPLDITPVAIEEEMKRSYLDYAMSVIVSRALPDVRDGLKPVHRRILYAMKEAGNEWNRAFRKSARVVGDVMGNYHPHGNVPIYEAMVRMAQDFSMRVRLVEGQGNYGSMDGDPPAAERYTEARLSHAADALLEDYDKETVDFQPNYDGSRREPVALPARFPNLLVNGAQGIAVGMATNIPTHNLGEVIDAAIALIDNPALTIEELMEFVPGPDFPTGGVILGRTGIHAAYRLGRGSITIRGAVKIEELGRDREAIVVTEVPYQVNKARMVERIAEVVREKLVEGISDLRDESDRDGVRVVVELKRDVIADVVLNQLYRHTPLQTSFGVNMLALNAGRPETLTLKDVLVAFLAFREEVVTRRTVFLLNKARERAHTLVGLAIAVANIDEMIALIRAAPDPATARAQLMEREWPAQAVASLIALVEERAAGGIDTYRLSDEQAKAILDLRLQRLTGLERDKIAEELGEVAKEILRHLEILRSRPKLLDVVRGELAEVKAQFATPRKTMIEDLEFEADLEALIQREDMVVTVTNNGYIKRVPLSTYRAQRRGGRGRTGATMRAEDVVSQVFVASTHAPVLFFTSSGRVYRLKVHRLPIGTPHSRGKAMVNLLPNLAANETITNVMPLAEDEGELAGRYVVFATAKGNVRRNAISDFSSIHQTGKIAMKFEGEDADDRLIAAAICTAQDDILLATRGGRCIRFPVDDVRVFTGRTSVGVRGIRLAGDGDAVVSLSVLRHEDVSTEERYGYLRLSSERRRAVTGEIEPDEPEAESGEGNGHANGHASGNGVNGGGISEERFADFAAREEFLLTVTEKGFGKRTSAYEYPITGRGGQGRDNIVPERGQGATVAVFPVGAGDQVMLVSDQGMVIRFSIDGISIRRRRSGGVVLIKVGEGERVVSAARFPEAESVEDGSSEGTEA